MPRLDIHALAADELLAAEAYYDGRAPTLGAALKAAFREVLDHIEEAPLSFPAHRRLPRYRRAVVIGWPYTIVFRPAGDVVRVLAFAHTRRAPDYWTGRR